MVHHNKSMFQEMFQEMSVHCYSNGREEGHMIMLGNDVPAMGPYRSTACQGVMALS